MTGVTNNLTNPVVNKGKIVTNVVTDKFVDGT